MKTSQYDADTRYSIKRLSRTSEFSKILDKGRNERKALEGKLSERNDTIAALRKAIQGQIDNGAWNSDWEKLGFKKKAEA